MLKPIRCLLLCVIISCAAAGSAYSTRVTGRVIEISGQNLTADFPVPVKPSSIMVVLAGSGEAVAGTAVSRQCSGAGPYCVRGSILFVGDAVNLVAGREVYVNSMDTLPAPSKVTDPEPQPVAGPSANDLKLYYYAAGQNVGYGTLGLGYERSVRISRGLGLELDGGITAVGNLNSQDASVVDTDQLIKSLNARTRFDFSDTAGFYAAYRWSEGRGDDQSWSRLVNNLPGKTFVAPSEFDDGTVRQQGLEYGLTFRPTGKFALSVGFIPQYRTDYGMFGVCTAPGYTGELRFGTGRGALRLRGIKSDDYWQADLGITIR